MQTIRELLHAELDKLIDSDRGVDILNPNIGIVDLILQSTTSDERTGTVRTISSEICPMKNGSWNVEERTWLVVEHDTKTGEHISKKTGELD